MKEMRRCIHRESYYRLAAFLSSILAGALFILPFSLKNGGFYYLGSDFVEQQVTFWSYCNAAVKSGDLFWAPVIDLGTGFIGAFSFYVIGSPYFWLSLLFPADSIYLLMGPLLMLKMGVCGLAAYCYICQFVKEPKWAVICSLLYTFSGYQISNMNFNHFYDVTSLFPFLLLALDHAVLRGRKGCFAVCVALLALTNPVFFPGIVVFLCLYFLARLFWGDYRLTPRLFLQLAAESILGVGISAVLVLPTVFSLVQNPRVSSASFASLPQMLLLKPIYWAELIRGMLFPAECIFDRAFYLQGFTNGAELYLPVFGMVLAVAYCFTHRKSWLARLLLICAVFAVIPVLNSAFVLFNAEYYTRWYFMPILLLCTASAQTLEDRTVSLRPGVLFYLGLWAALAAVGLAFTFYFQVTFIYNLIPAAAFALISLGGFCVTLLTRRIQHWWKGAALLAAAVILCSACTGAINTYYHSRTRAAFAVHALDTSAAQITLPDTAAGYRINSGYYFMNLGVMLGQPSVSTFASNITGSLFDFYSACGIPRSVISQPELDNAWLEAFLSVRYHIVLFGAGALSDDRYYEQTEQQGDFLVGTARYTVPMGYVIDAYITEEEFAALPAAQRQAVLLRALVLTDAQQARYGGMLEHLDLSVPPDTSDAALAEVCEARRAHAADSFLYTRTGASASITLEQESLVFFSIPYDEGFTVLVNGHPVEPERVDCAFYAVPCSAGKNDIAFRYMPRGLCAGVAISAFSLLALICLLLWERRKRRNVPLGKTAV